MTTSSDERFEGYEVLLDPHAIRDLDRLERQELRRVDEKIKTLARDPRPFGVEKLTSRTYRVRTGDWRIIYLVDDNLRRVVVARVKRRNERTYG